MPIPPWNPLIIQRIVQRTLTSLAFEERAFRYPRSGAHLPLDPLYSAYASANNNFNRVKTRFRYLGQHGNGKRGQQEREEARGFVSRAVKARNSKWLGVETCEM